MADLILPRRRFLFMAPAIVAASSLMPGHSIAHLLAPPIRKFELVRLNRLSFYSRPIAWGFTRDVCLETYPDGSFFPLTEAEIKHYADELLNSHFLGSTIRNLIRTPV